MDVSLAVVLAAGIGSRLKPLTNESPKCMLDVQGRSILNRALDTFEALGIRRSVVIGGYRSDRLLLRNGCKLVLNQQFDSNNILHSLANAREEMDGADTALVSYSDIVFQRSVVERLLATDSSDIVIVVDQAWAKRYDGRMLHPLAQAEAVRFNDKNLLIRTGKDLLTVDSDTRRWGEFIGMMKLTTKGQELFWSIFDEINAGLAPESPFQQATSWRQAYLSDFLQELVDRGIDVHCCLIQGGWLEIDTLEDYEAARTFDFAEGSG